MEFLDNNARGLLVGQLKRIGFSVGEAESRAEGLESEKDLEYLIQYIGEHENVSVDEIRMVHTRMVRQQDMKRIETKKTKSSLTDRDSEGKGLLLRGANIDWSKDGLEPYLRNIASLHGVERMVFKKPVTFFVGENGCGKSTLLEGIAVAAGYNPEGGTKNYNFSTNDTHSALHNAITLVKGTRKPAWGVFLRAETFYNMATEAENLDKEYGGMFERYGGSSFHKQSHGESFYSMLEGDITENGMYFLDEPEAALSPRRQLNLLGMLHKYANRGSQFVIATHSPILLACPNASIYEFSDAGVNEIGYEDTDIYQIVSGFVKDRDKMLRDVIIDERKY